MTRIVRLGLIAATLSLSVALAPAVAGAYGGYSSSYTPTYGSSIFAPSYGGYSSTYSPSYGYSSPSYTSPSYGRNYFNYGSNGSYYGQPNRAGFPKNQYVSPYVKKNGTYVSGYWRNSPRDGLPTCKYIRC